MGHGVDGAPEVEGLRCGGGGLARGAEAPGEGSLAGGGRELLDGHLQGLGLLDTESRAADQVDAVQDAGIARCGDGARGDDIGKARSSLLKCVREGRNGWQRCAREPRAGAVGA